MFSPIPMDEQIKVNHVEVVEDTNSQVSFTTKENTLLQDARIATKKSMHCWQNKLLKTTNLPFSGP